MAQALHSVLIATPSFRHGYAMGLSRTYRGDIKLPENVNEETLVEIISNLCFLHADGELSQEVLRQDIGLVVGWVLVCQQ